MLPQAQYTRLIVYSEGFILMSKNYYSLYPSLFEIFKAVSRTMLPFDSSSSAGRIVFEPETLTAAITLPL